MKVVLATLNAKFIHSSLALRYLKAASQKVTSNTVVKDYSINNHLLDMAGDIYSESPKVVGLACYIWNIEMTLKLAEIIKKILPNTFLVLGGPEVSYESLGLMREYQYIDCIVLGEGEETFTHLLQKIKNDEDFKGIPGVVFRKNEQIISSAPQVVADLNSIPFPYQDEDMASLKDKIIYYESSRGCPFSCQYCLSSATNGVRFWPLVRVFEDLRFFLRHNVRQVKFVDRTFNARKDYYLPILKFLAQQDGETNFHFEIAADLLDEEVLEILQQLPPGRVQFEIGVQSTHEPTLQQIQRRNDWGKISKYVTQIMSYKNIHLHLDLIVGLPFETYELFGRSFNDVYELQPHMLQIGFLKLLRGSGIRQDAAKYGYLFMDTAPYEVLGNQYLDYSQIYQLKIFEELFNQMYNSGRFLHFLPFLIHITGKDAFSFYETLTQYWIRKQLHTVAHSTKSMYKHLAEFCKEYCPNEEKHCLEMLKLNSLLSEKGSIRPDFLPWNEMEWAEDKNRFWRNEALVRKYIPKYTFTNWREIKKQYHLEVFSTNVVKEYFSKNDCKFIPILFSYAEREVSYHHIDPADFFAMEDSE